MSVLDDLRRAQEQLVARLNELEPLVAEYQELRQEADRLGLSPAEAQAASAEPSPAPAKAPARSRRRSTRTSRAGGAKRQPGGSRGGSRESALLQLVAATPGITVTAAGKELGVDPTGLYRPVRKLVAEGRIDKRGPALHPAASE